jgi:hypothetical protein
MIRLTRQRDASAIPTDFRGSKLIEKHVDLVERYFSARLGGKPIAFESSKWKSAKAKLRIDTGKKCGYCEAPTSAVAHGDVEHFRPKSLYWWLAYRFDNYLFSCQICNQIYKVDFFPITAASALAAPAMPAAVPADKAAGLALAATLAKDASILNDADLIAEWGSEEADLVHPYLEDPEPLFFYEADESNEEVWIRAMPGDRAARGHVASTKYLGLNREELRKQRYVSYETMAIIKVSHDNQGLTQGTRKQIERLFARMRRSDYPFAGMHRYFLTQWGYS